MWMCVGGAWLTSFGALGESSNLSLLVRDSHGPTDTVHYPLPENVRGLRARLTELDSIEIGILHQRGAFLLPPKALCDELVEAYFKWIAPIVPVINRSRFMRRYRDPKNPPSRLLLQAMLLAGSRVCANPQLMDPNGSTTPAALTFYKRAKALYDANYEDDRITIVQALVLMGWYWEGPEGSSICFLSSHVSTNMHIDVTQNVFYWSRVATIVAQGSGMHRRFVLSLDILNRLLILNHQTVLSILSWVGQIRDYGSGFGGHCSLEIARLQLLWGGRCTSTQMTLMLLCSPRTIS